MEESPAPPETARLARGINLPVSERRLLLLVADLAAVNVAMMAAFNLRTTQVRQEGLAVPRFAMVVITVLWVISAQMVDAYDLRAAARIRSTLRLVGLTTGVATLGLLLTFLAQPFRITRPTILIWVPVAFTLVLLERLLYRRVLAHSFLAGRIVLVMTGEAMAAVWPEVQDHLESLYSVAGIVNPTREDAPARLETIVAERNVSSVVLGVRDELPRPLFRAIVHCHDAGVPARSLADLYEEVTGRMLLDQLGHTWLLSLPMRSQTSHVYSSLKRALDVGVSVIVLIVGAPVMAVAAIAIKISSRGPVLHHQQRIGRYGRPFTITKLRTMRQVVVDAGHPWTEPADQRITAVGRLLRAVHLDELPQAWTILRGDMSIIGPRPEQEHYVRELEKEIDYYSTRHTVRPGLTGWAQVNYGYAANVDQARVKLSYDLFYIKRQTLSLDLLILGRTVLTVLSLGGR